MVDRRTFAGSAAAALALAAVPSFKAVALPSDLSISHLAAAYEGLRLAIDGTLGVANQPRAEGPVGYYLDKIRDGLYECIEPVVEAAKASKPRSIEESQIRCEILIRHAMQVEFTPESIAETMKEWNNT